MGHWDRQTGDQRGLPRARLCVPDPLVCAGPRKNGGQIGGNIFATDYLDDFAHVFSGHSGAQEYLILPLANLPRIVKNQTRTTICCSFSGAAFNNIPARRWMY
jgi:hypothetical protein